MAADTNTKGLIYVNWKHFKSGTDIRACASEGVEGEHIELTDEVCSRITEGFMLWLCKKTGKKANELKLAVGHDSRISADRISAAVKSAMVKAGASVLDSGLSSTPAMFMICLDNGLDGSVQITASHHPFNRNGLKFFTPESGLEGSDISEILAYCENGDAPEACDGGKVTAVDYMSDYAASLRALICKRINAADYEHPLKGYKIAVDAGNGVGGFYARDVLAPLGADISASRYLEPDGMFPNHIPNPENKQAMASICEATVEGKCDLGLIFDTDVDRAGAVDEKGEEINRNRLIALASAIALEGNEGGTIVTDSTTSLGLKGFIENELGGVHFRYRRGYRNVIDKAVELNAQGINCPLAIETSGHAAMRENHFLDDGAYLVTLILIKFAQLKAQGKSLDSLTSAMKNPAEEAEIRLKLTNEDFRADGEKILADLESYAGKQEGWTIADDNREGIRVYFDGGDWFLLRLSVHDPIMPLNLEAQSEGGCVRAAKALYECVKDGKGIDLSPLTDFIAGEK